VKDYKKNINTPEMCEKSGDHLIAWLLANSRLYMILGKGKL